jgi:hypothetical protein
MIDYNEERARKVDLMINETIAEQHHVSTEYIAKVTLGNKTIFAIYTYIRIYNRKKGG